MGVGLPSRRAVNANQTKAMAAITSPTTGVASTTVSGRGRSNSKGIRPGVVHATRSPAHATPNAAHGVAMMVPSPMALYQLTEPGKGGEGCDGVIRWLGVR